MRLEETMRSTVMMFWLASSSEGYFEDRKFDVERFLDEVDGRPSGHTAVVRTDVAVTERRIFRVPSEFVQNPFTVVEPVKKKNEVTDGVMLSKEDRSELEAALKECDKHDQCENAALFVARYLRLIPKARTLASEDGLLPYFSIGGFREMVLDYYRIVNESRPHVICEVGQNYGASMAVMMLGASPRTRGVVFGEARSYRGYAMDFLQTLFTSNSSTWLPSICGARDVHSSPEAMKNSRVFFVPGDSHQTIDGFARSAWDMGETCRAEVSRWLPPGTSFNRVGRDGSATNASALRCDLVNIDGDRSEVGVAQDIRDMRRHSRLGLTQVLVDVTDPGPRAAVDDALKNGILDLIEERRTAFVIDNAGPEWREDRYEASKTTKIWRGLRYSI